MEWVPTANPTALGDAEGHVRRVSLIGFPKLAKFALPNMLASWSAI